VLKELAHLENRVNTYVMQLQQGLHDKLGLDTAQPFEIRSLDELVSKQPMNPETDVICLPTVGDNRALTAVFRAAGYTCIENFGDETYDLQALVKAGRRVAGQMVCTPLAALYSDLKNGADEFARRKQAGDPEFADKRRLILIDTQGSGPCRQGQYPGLHRLFFKNSAPPSETPDRSCSGMPGGALVEFMLLEEDEGYSSGLPDWMMLRFYQGVILKSALQDMLFNVGAECRDYAEYQRFVSDHRALQAEIYGLLEAWKGPGRFSRKLISFFGRHSLASIPIMYFAYRAHGLEFIKPLRRFATKWQIRKTPASDRLNIMISGEGYMRLSQAPEIFNILLAAIGFRRFNLKLSPVMSYMEVILHEALEQSRTAIENTRSRQARVGRNAVDAAKLRLGRRRFRMIRLLTGIWRNVLARPLYRASRLEMPPPIGAMISASRELIPTYRPVGELAPYVGEALVELRHGVDVVLNVAPNGCMVSTMGEIMGPSIMHAQGVESGRIQTLLSAEGDVDEEVLTLAVLKAIGPLRYYQRKQVTA
jgi:hypothetical protein